MIIPMSRAPRSLRPQAARGARQNNVATAISAGLKSLCENLAWYVVAAVDDRRLEFVRL